MAAHPYRRTERAVVGLYALVAAASVPGYRWMANAPASGPTEPAPTGGAAFAAVGLFWLCALVAAAMAVVVVAANVQRHRRGHEIDGLALASSLAVLCCLPGAALAAFALTRIALALGLLVVALGVAPAALLAATWGDRYRRELTTAT